MPSKVHICTSWTKRIVVFLMHYWLNLLYICISSFCTSIHFKSILNRPLHEQGRHLCVWHFDVVRLCPHRAYSAQFRTRAEQGATVANGGARGQTGTGWRDWWATVGYDESMLAACARGATRCGYNCRVLWATLSAIKRKSSSPPRHPVTGPMLVVVVKIRWRSCGFVILYKNLYNMDNHSKVKSSLDDTPSTYF